MINLNNDYKIFCVIVNWNGSKDTIECVKSLLGIKYKLEIIVVDNGSDRDDIALIESSIGLNIHLIQNNENLGFSIANNMGIKYALENNGSHVLILNNDTIVDKQFLKELIIKSNLEANIGITAPLIFYNHDKSLIWSGPGYISKIKGSGFTKFENKSDDANLISQECTFVSGCCMLIKREVFQSIGLLDPKYFLYLEDTDFCYRTSKAGFKIYFVKESHIYHKASVSTKKFDKLLPLYYVTRNRLYFAKKNFGLYYYFVFYYLVFTMFVKFIINTNRSKFAHYVYLAFVDFFRERMGRMKERI